MSTTVSGPWDQDELQRFLSRTVYPMRLACLGRQGFPKVVSVWFRYRDDCLQCVTHRSSHLATLLGSNEKVGFEVATNDPPYHGVRGSGSATLVPLGSDPALEELLERYVGGLDSKLATWLLSRKAEELLITIQPRELFSWDYRERMSDIAQVK